MSDPPPTVDEGGMTTINTAEAPHVATPSSEGPREDFVEPRLGIRHLMLWTALTAVLLVVLQTRQIQSLYPAAHKATAWLYPATSAAALMVVGLRLAWRRRGGRFLAEPGHGIALLTLLQFLAHAPVQILWAIYFADPSNSEASFAYFQSDAWLIAQSCSVIGAFIAGFISLGFAVWLARHWAWRMYFVARPLMAFTSWGLTFFLTRTLSASTIGEWAESGLWSLIHLTPRTIPLALLVLACAIDRRSRHWTHWWGILAAVVPTLVWLVTTLVLVILVLGGYTPG